MKIALSLSFVNYDSPYGARVKFYASLSKQLRINKSLLHTDLKSYIKLQFFSIFNMRSIPNSGFDLGILSQIRP